MFTHMHPDAHTHADMLMQRDAHTTTNALEKTHKHSHAHAHAHAHAHTR